MGALEAFSQLLGARIQTNGGCSILSADPALQGASCPRTAPTLLGSTPPRLTGFGALLSQSLDGDQAILQRIRKYVKAIHVSGLSKWCFEGCWASPVWDSAILQLCHGWWPWGRGDLSHAASCWGALFG